MARNKNKKRKNKNLNGKHDVLGVTLIVISAFLLLCIVIKPILGIFSEAIFGVILGTFGIMAYPILIALLLLGIFILLGRTVSASTRLKVCLPIAIVFALIILQLATTHQFLTRDFSGYIEAVYSAKFSAGGVIMGLIAFGLKSLITEIACYVIFSVALVVTVLFMVNAFSRIGVWNSARKSKKAQKEAPEPEAPIRPAEPQLVIDATPNPGLFTGRIERPTAEMSMESGTATDMPTRNKRAVSDYGESPVMDEPERSTTAEIAHKTLYGDSEEIRRQTVETFKQKRETQAPPPAPVPVPTPGSTASSAPTEIVEPPYGGGFMDPAERVYTDAHDPERPRRVDYEGTPNNLNALYFPPEKSIQFNDVGIESIEDPAPPPQPVREEPVRPSFDRPKQTRQPLAHVEPIIDASAMSAYTEPRPEPITHQAPIIDPSEPSSLAAEESFLRTYGATRPVAQEPVVEPAPERIPPLESDRFKQEEILDADDTLDLFGKSQRGDEVDFIPQQEEILDGSAPYEVSDIEEAQPDNPIDEGIMDGSLVITNDEPVDLSEHGFDNGDVFTGEDLSGMYVDADGEESLPVTAPKAPKLKKSNAPLENQMSIDNLLQDQAQGSVVTQETKKYRKYNYTPPPFDLLKLYDHVESSQEDLQTNAQILEDVCSRFLKTQVKVINIVPGPQVTRYELEVPSGTSVKAIETRSADIAYELAAVSGIRVEAPIPGKRAVGIEVPNKKKAIVGLREVVDSNLFMKHKSPMVFSVGKDIGGELVVCDLEKIPHLLIAGQTGSGKSAGLNSLIVSLLYKASPDDLRFILIDPKRVEFSKFRGMPHSLFEKTITEPNEALNALKWADNEMNRRFTVLAKYACSKLAEYNALPEVKSGKLSKLPHIVIIIDELANLMQSAVASEIESKISSIAALARAAGIHLIVATQRPSADVITGTIKANLTSRIAFKVPDAMNSRIIIDVVGAEALSGDGDMLFYPQDAFAPRRVQGSFVNGDEVLSVVSYLKEHYEPDFDEDAERFVGGGSGGNGGMGDGGTELDPLASRIMAHAIKSKQISTSVIQRRFSIGYARAARIVDSMEANGYIGPSTGNSKPRDVLMTVEQYREVFGHDLDDN